VNTLRGFISWTLLALVTIIMFIPVFIFSSFLFLFVDRDRKWSHSLVSLWAKLVLVVCPFMRVHMSGLEHLKGSRPYVLVCNHQSLADIIAVLHLPHPFKFIAKKELFWIPFLGWALWVVGYIPLVRGDRFSGRDAVRRAIELLTGGTSVLFFPEGTRSRGGEIGKFKIGAFKIAAEQNLPVVPIVISGTRKVIQKGSFMMGGTTEVTLNVGQPTTPLGTTVRDIEDFSVNVRSNMMARLQSLR
jgi:1-acyl-sn-glycerol-3-phosphate acyltransferase